MVARGSGRVLHIGSGMAHTPAARVVGVRRRRRPGPGRLTDSLAAALEGTGVTVLEMSPGLVRTDMTETMWGPPDEQAWNAGARPSDRPVVRFARASWTPLHGRFVHAARDDLDAARGRADEIVAADARTLRLRTVRRGRPARLTSRSHQDRARPPAAIAASSSRIFSACRCRRSASAGLSPTAVRPIRPCSVRQLIMWKTMPVWRDWSKCRPCRATMSNRSSTLQPAQRR